MATNDTPAISTQVRNPTYRKPEWVDYVHARSPPGHVTAGADKRKKKGFFRKYGLYIIVSIGIALAHGIHSGIKDLQAEVRREEAAAAQRQRRQTDQPSVVVSRNRKASRVRKRSTPKGSAK